MVGQDFIVWEYIAMVIKLVMKVHLYHTTNTYIWMVRTDKFSALLQNIGCYQYPKKQTRYVQQLAASLF